MVQILLFLNVSSFILDYIDMAQVFRFMLPCQGKAYIVKVMFRRAHLIFNWTGHLNVFRIDELIQQNLPRQEKVQSLRQADMIRPEGVVNPPTGSSEAHKCPVVEVRRLGDGRPGLFHWEVSTSFNYKYMCSYKLLKKSWFCYAKTRDAERRTCIRM